VIRVAGVRSGMASRIALRLSMACWSKAQIPADPRLVFWTILASPAPEASLLPVAAADDLYRGNQCVVVESHGGGYLVQALDKLHE